MANNTNPISSDKWYFTKEQLENTPSRKCGYDSFKELSYRQQTANFIQDMGQRLKVSQLCINTAIVYMHRFYVFHSFSNFPWHQMGAAALFLAAKVEEQPRKLEYVIRVANMCRNNRDTSIDVNSERYIAQSQDLVFNENVLLQTLGFDVAIDHPHTHVVRCCHLVKASKDLAQSSYFLASNSLHLTTMCLQYKPTVVACFCIHLACKWASWEIPLSSEKKEWFLYIDPTVTSELLQQLTDEFLSIFESCPSRLKEKIMSIGDNGMHNTPNTITNSPFDTDPKKITSSDQKDGHSHRTHDSKEGEQHKHRRPHESSSHQQREREYREKKEREKLAQQHGLKSLPPGVSKQPPSTSSSHHHRPPVDPKLKQPHSRPPSSHPGARPAEPRDILREAARDSPFGIATKDYNLHNKSDSSTSSSSAVNLKDVKQRDYNLLKPNAIADTNAYGYNGDKSRPLPNNKVPMKHDQVRRYDVKPDPDQKRPSVPGHDRNSSYMGKNMNSTSQKVKSPFQNQDANVGVGAKSVLKPSGSSQQLSVKHHHNGNANNNSSSSSSASNNLSSGHYNQQIKEEVINPHSNHNKDEHLLQQHSLHQQSKEEVPSPVKKPSLFSPEKSPIEHKNIVKSAPIIKNENLLSPLQSPVNNMRRSRNYSTGSEPELRPVMKKIDQVEGFENLTKDPTIGLNKLHQVPDIITPISDNSAKLGSEPTPNYSKETKPPDIIPPLCSDANNISTSQPILVNGMETNPMLISSLLKEAPTIPHLPVVAKPLDTVTQSSAIAMQTTSTLPMSEAKDKDHHHHKSKKKNKEKHKHKDKDKSREDKEKKKKHKDKDRDKHKHKDKHDTISEPPIPTEPIKIKIQKDKIQPVVAPNPSNPLKIKIAKDVIKSDPAASNGGGDAPLGGIKIKIPREKISNCTSDIVEKSSRKRERDRSVSGDAPPGKMSRASGVSGHRENKQNGRHSTSYGKQQTEK